MPFPKRGFFKSGNFLRFCCSALLSLWAFYALPSGLHSFKNEKLRDPFANDPYPVQDAHGFKEAIKFIGFIRKDDTIWALMGQSGGKIFSLKKGDILKEGNHKSRVLYVGENFLKLLETGPRLASSKKQVHFLYMSE